MARWSTPTRRVTSAHPRWLSTPSSSSPAAAVSGPSRPPTSSTTSSRPRSARASLLTAIRVPKHTGWGGHYEKFVRVAHQWSIIAVAATVRVEGGSIAEARIGLTNMGSTPLRASSVEAALIGAAATEDAVREACAAASEGTDPPSDLNGSADYRRAIAPVLTRRAVLAAAGG